VKKEQGIIAEEIRMYHDHPWERCFQNLMEGLYEKNPVRKNICGSEESIASITPEILYRCYETFYQPSNMALIVCGDVEPEAVMSLVDESLGKKKRETVPVVRLTEKEREDVFLPAVSAYMQVAKPIFSIGIKDTDIPTDPAERQRRDAAMSLLDEILFSRSARFYSTLFEEGILSPSYSYGYSIADSFAFHTVSGESECPEEILRRLREYLKEAAEKGIDPEEFERCRRILYADQIRSYDSTEEIANTLLAFVFDDAEMFDYPALIESLTVSEVEALLNTLTDEKKICLSVVYPHKKEKENRNGLQQ
jgi:predicted Zn-dependent peptidase